VATACASPPEGRARWTLNLLADAIVKLTDHQSLSCETVRRRLAENDLKPWRRDMWCIPQVDGEFARMASPIPKRSCRRRQRQTSLPPCRVQQGKEAQRQSQLLQELMDP